MKTATCSLILVLILLNVAAACQVGINATLSISTNDNCSCAPVEEILDSSKNLISFCASNTRNVSKYLSSSQDCSCFFFSSITLQFMPGDHYFDEIFSLSDVEIFEMNGFFNHSISSSNNTTIFCSDGAHLELSNIKGVKIGDLTFVGCDVAIILSVKQFVLSNTNVFKQNGFSFTNVDMATIQQSNFSGNKASILKKVILWGFAHIPGTIGGAISAYNSQVNINESIFSNNSADYGGAVYASDGSIIHISNTSFSDNRAVFGGAVKIYENTSAYIHECKFTKNSVSIDGGAVEVAETSSIDITSSLFVYNSADFGGAVLIVNGSAHIYNCSFTNNSVTFDDDVSNNSVLIQNSTFAYQNAGYGGAVDVYRKGKVDIQSCTFKSNAAQYGGTARHVDGDSKVDINNSSFTYHGANSLGGAIHATDNSSVVLSNSFFSYNRANTGGAIVLEFDSKILISDCTFSYNIAQIGGVMSIHAQSLLTLKGMVNVNKNVGIQGLLYVLQSTAVFSGNVSVINNTGSLFALSSFISFRGDILFSDNSPHNTSLSSAPSLLRVRAEGGALTAFQSNLLITGKVLLINNTADFGGAILATESRLNFSWSEESAIAANTARLSGGGIHAYQSEIDLKGNGSITRNTAANKGGGMYAISTTTKLSGGSLHFIENTAMYGGGMFLELNSKLYIIKERAEFMNGNTNDTDWINLDFNGNRALMQGGAIYVSDNTTSATCSSRPSQTQNVANECFFQVLSLHGNAAESLNVANTKFFNNTSGATERGTLYGGLLDRCTVSPFAEILDTSNSDKLNGLSYIYQTTQLSNDSMFSDPVRICFCVNDIPDCSYQPSTVQVVRGAPINVSLVAVDHVDHPIAAIIHTSLSSQNSGLEVGQVRQESSDTCTELIYNVFSPEMYERLLFFAEGPCTDSGVSLQYMNVVFLNCACPIGFQPLGLETNCTCVCDSLLMDYVTECDIETESVLRDGNYWIRWYEESNSSGYIIHPHCPFDFCHSTDRYVNLNDPDTQCTFNRSGDLCGSCADGLSLLFGGSYCKPCRNNWLALLLPFGAAGIVLVALIFTVNLTTSVGTINGLIFYANILVVNRATYLPNSRPTLLTVFLSWLNLDLGFETCFYDGMDAYSKTWLQLAFPTYILILIFIMILILHYYSQRFSQLLANRNPIKTLATLFLLSYAKYLRTIITVFSLTFLGYPDGSIHRVWLFDATVPYCTGKHLVLFIVTLFIIFVGLIYTFLLLCWQWLILIKSQHKLLRCPLRLLNNLKLKLLMDAYHAPLCPHHRYWSGLLLLVRIILYDISAVNVLGDPSINLMSIIVLMQFLLVVKLMIRGRVYREYFIDVLETSFLVNLVVLSVLTYHIREKGGKQLALANTSIGIAFLTFLVVLAYHVHTYTLNKSAYWKKIVNKLQIKTKLTRSTELNEPIPNDDSRHSPSPRRDLAELIPEPPTESDYVLSTLNLTQNNECFQKTSQVIEFERDDEPAFSTQLGHS